MKLRGCIRRDEKGAATIEMAFALPALIVMIWMFVQLAQVYRAVAGIQQALGQGARFATLCTSPTVSGCTSPSANEVQTKIVQSVFGVGPGTFTVPSPTSGSSGTASYYDLTVSYSQPTNLIFFTGPTINVTRSKRVWIAKT